MFQSWRLKLREADEALKAGRIEEARSRLERDNLLEFLPGKRLAGRLATKFLERAGQQLGNGEWDSVWRDLLAASALGGENAEFVRARQQVVVETTRDIEQRLRQGDSAGAMAQIERLERQKVGSHDLSTLREIARRLESARHLGKRGRFSDAEAQLMAVVALRPEWSEPKRNLDECREKAEQVRGLAERLHRALGACQWDETAALADQLLAIAPDYRLAQDARQRAWAEVGARVTGFHPTTRTQTWCRADGSTSRESLDSSVGGLSGPRMLLWIDGVGGYLVCLADEVIVGQAAPGNRVDIPLLADISRRHVKISRRQESYLLEPLHATRINGRAVQSKTLLSDGDEIELGTGARLRFRQPHALSGSARLEFISRHRPRPYADGVLLMAESCVLGPKWQNHVVCREWSGDVVLYRQDDQLYCRAVEAIEIDGQLCDGRGRIEGNSRIVGRDFSLSLEELDRCSSQPLL